MVRIGRLYMLKDKLDRAINQYKQIEKIMQNGFSYKEALKIVERRENFGTTGYKFSQEYVLMKEDIKEASKDDVEKIRNLYRKLTVKYHPDLVKDPDEKRKREKIMKKINKAYKELNLQELTNIFEEQMVYNFTNNSADFLKRKLTDYLNKIIQLEKEYKELIQTEWYVWMKKIEKARKEKTDPFKNLEMKLQEDIKKRKIIINDLKLKYEK